MASYVRYRNFQALEWAAGTYAVPVTSAPHEVENFGFTPIVSNDGANTVVVGEAQMYPGVPGGHYGSISFSLKLAGSDTADVPPICGSLLRACGFRETENGTTPNIGYKYALADPHLMTGLPAGYLDPITFGVYYDKLYYQIVDAVGSCTINWVAGQIPMMQFNFIGYCVSTSTGAIPKTPGTFTASAKPMAWGSSTTTTTVTRTADSEGSLDVTGSCTGTTSTTVLIDSTAHFIRDRVYAGDAIELDVGLETATVVSVDSDTQITSTALSGTGTYDSGEAYTITRAASYAPSGLVIPRIQFSSGNAVTVRADGTGAHGYTGALITGRNPILTVTMEAPALGILNVETAYAHQETIDYQWLHESGAGDRHKLTAKASTKINSNPALSDIGGGKLGYNLPCMQSIDTGDDIFELSWQGT